MIRTQVYHAQRIKFDFDPEIPPAGNTFALTFKSKINETFTTIPIVLNSAVVVDNDYSVLADDIRDALVNLPNRVIDDVHVEAGFQKPAVNETDTTGTLNIKVVFTGANNQGDQNLLIVEDFACADGCFPRVTGFNSDTATTQQVEVYQNADFNSYECGRRGKCDYDTGVCQCFEGFTGNSCNQCTSLI